MSEKQEIKPGKEIRFILQQKVFGLIINHSELIGILFKLVKLPNILHSYSFDNTQDDDIISKHEEYKKFFKMVNLGVLRCC